jgi:Glucodextranase, domain B
VIGVVRGGLVLACGALTLAVSACGGDDAQPRRPEPRVRVEITSPSDTATVRRGTVDVRGRVVPATATVRVMGRPALVSGGGFSVVVPLDAGVNVVDVAATARGRRPALAAFRVTRDQRVVVPDLTDVRLDDLEPTLAPRDLSLEVQRADGFLDQFVPSPLGVCEQEPPMGSRVRRGTTVRVVVSRAC